MFSKNIFAKGFTCYNDPEGDDGTGTGTGTGTGGAGGTLTQDQVNAIVADRVARAKTSVLKELGVTDAAQAKKDLEAAKLILDEKKTAEQRALEATEASTRAQTEREAAMALKEFKVNVRAALIEAEAPKAALERLTGLLSVGQGATEEEIAADVAKLKSDPFFGVLFGKKDDEGKGMPGGDPGKGSKGKGSGGVNEYEEGLKMAKSSVGSSEVPTLYKGLSQF